jgi:prepilin-type N-terminal cleavage/methylation domain-containing protein
MTDNEKKKIKNQKYFPGLTLLEMMMAIAIFSIGMAGFTALFSSAWRNNSFALEMGQASMSVSQGLNKMVGYIRGTRQADNGDFSLISANNNELVIYSDYNKDGITERLHFYKNGQDVLMGIRNPSGTMPVTYQSGDAQVVTIASHIVNSASEPIFYYFDKDFAGNESTDPALFTPADISEIRIVKIHLKININPNRAPDNIEMQSFVEMRNLNDYDRIQ